MSGVGKGLATASIGKILQEYGFKTTAVKIDPYINFDAGTLRPTEHGEVWVTDDGGEIDQDLGNYERFLGISIPKKNNITTGQVFKKVIDKERKGEYLGSTVSIIPHVTNEIKRRVKESSYGYDFALVEIGGTVGDYENVPFIFAMKDLEKEFGRENIIYFLITYLPIPGHVGEMKTKPTQQAINRLSENGIFPDFILCRAREPVDDVRKKKIETYAHIDPDCIISAPDVKTLYTIPLNFEKDNLGMKILEKFQLRPRKEPDWERWRMLADIIENPKRILNIAMIGKYVDIGSFTLYDSYISINEALKHAGAENDVGVRIEWVDSKKLEFDNHQVEKLRDYDGIIVPGGFGSSGVEGKINAIKFARENNIPFLGLCYGLQLSTIEFARNVCGMHDAHTTEINPETKCPVIDILPGQRELIQKNDYGGTMRLGAYAAKLKESSKVFDLYNETGRFEEDKERLQSLRDNKEFFRIGLIYDDENVVLEKHRHRYECNPRFLKELESKGLVFSGYHIRDDGEMLMEFLELPTHKFFVATQSHPEYRSRLGKPAPLFYGFVRACLEK